ncbi:MAG: DUF523 domain-containing protein [Oscillospiraceae bacterium]|nr:DUF523 domain-containing protein [Oscillospiraceae bacterium]
MEPLLISACLLGARCKYNGGHNALPPETLEALRRRYRLVPICPETAGGLPVPREPSERRAAGVYSRSGRDVTAAYQKGAACARQLAQEEGCRLAILKERSPSCGVGSIYDGTFTGTQIPGNGVTVDALLDAGLTVYGESGVDTLLE